MSAKQRQKIDNFFFVLAVVSVALAAIVIVTFKGVFSAVITAYETDGAKLGEIRVDKDKLDQSYKAVFEKEYERLKLE